MSATYRISPLRQFLTILSVILAIGSLHCLEAQTGSEVAIERIDAKMVSTPVVTYTGASMKQSRPKSWMEIEVTFATAIPSPSLTEKYSDDLTINYYVLLKNSQLPQGAPRGTLLTGQTSLSTVPLKDKDLKSVIYISPRSLERFFNGKIPSSDSGAIDDIGVTISKQGQVVAQKSLKGQTQAWWPQFQQTPGYLLNKSETPFASLNWDYYEAVKKQ
jgi:hypothetical protein